MAAESWYAETPEQAEARRQEVMRQRRAEMGRFKNTPRPPEPPRADRLPHGTKRTREELELLLAHAQEQLQLGHFEGLSSDAFVEWSARSRLAGYFTDPRYVSMGIIEALRWLLGERDSSPLTGEVYDQPVTFEAITRETAQAADAIEGLGRYAGERDEDRADFAAGFSKAIAWTRGSERPLLMQPAGELPPTE